MEAFTLKNKVTIDFAGTKTRGFGSFSLKHRNNHFIKFKIFRLKSILFQFSPGRSGANRQSEYETSDSLYPFSDDQSEIINLHSAHIRGEGESQIRLIYHAVVLSFIYLIINDSLPFIRCIDETKSGCFFFTRYSCIGFDIHHNEILMLDQYGKI